MTEFDIEIRKLPPGDIYSIARILECGEGWKQLMAIIPGEDPQKPKYTVEHMKMVECAGGKQKRTCSEILLEEWGTSGQKRPQLSLLRDLLVKAELFRAADFVSTQLLKQGVPERPKEGPAALIEIPDTEELDIPVPTAPPYSETQQSLQLIETLPLSSQSELDVSELEECSYGEIELGTGGFQIKLGGGAFGDVFLWKSKSLAVKRLHDTTDVCLQFRRELRLLSMVSHPNLLPLTGFSTDGPSLCLLYTYMPNGSLLDRLKDEDCSLSLATRLNIAIGSAKGILHLHTLEEKPLVHRDVKTANILLDEDFNPKVGDFGLVRGGPGGGQSGALTTTVVGTSAYMAPEAFRGDVSPKMDVFSLGVVLLELITGLPPYDENREGCDLASHVEEVDDILTLMDRRITWGEHSERIAMGMFDVSQRCLMEKKQRPNTATVLQSLLALGSDPS